MHTLVFIAPSLVALASFAVWYVTRPVDFNATALRIAEEETRTEFENETWSRALMRRHPGNVTIKGY